MLIQFSSNLAKYVVPYTFLKRVCYIRTAGAKKERGKGRRRKRGLDEMTWIIDEAGSVEIESISHVSP